jgi:hypothetical protein
MSAASCGHKCPQDVIVAVHVCRGNFKGHYLGAGGYDKVAERFFAEAKVNHFLLEYDTPRAGDFAPLRFVPKGTGIVLGLISSKTPALESPDLLKRRIDEARRNIDLDRLAWAAMRLCQYSRRQPAYGSRRVGQTSLGCPGCGTSLANLKVRRPIADYPCIAEK